MALICSISLKTILLSTSSYPFNIFKASISFSLKGVTHVRVPRTSHSYKSLVRVHDTRSRGETIESGGLRK